MASLEFPHGKCDQILDNPHFLQTNSMGDFFSLGNPNVTNYQGFYLKRNGSYYKVLHSIPPHSSTESLRIGSQAVRKTGPKEFQKFQLFEEGIYSEISGRGGIILDCKKLHDESSEERMYKVQVKEAHNPAEGTRSLAKINVINIVYNKGRDYEIHIAVATTLSPKVVREWKQVNYSYDERRGTHNSNWVYKLLEFEGEGSIAVSADLTSKNVQSNALKLLLNGFSKQETASLQFETQIALDSLRTLTTNEGIMAGLPWFFHQWSRDELISCGGYLAVGELEVVGKILDKWHNSVRDDGTLPAIFPEEGLDSTDAPGWLAKRTLDFVTIARDKNEKLITKERLKLWHSSTGRMIDAISKKLTDNLIWTGRNTTWMDTDWNDEGREGACIEIQALSIVLCESHELLCRLTANKIEPERAKLAQLIVHGVHQRMCQGNILIDRVRPDGNPDFTVRPNIFIAWYVAPRMFSKGEWADFFDRALSELWLSWGGLSSISKNCNNFQPRYTGESVQSYHRGDSWYWVNNMAAMAMHAVDPKGFSNTVKNITRASVKDMLGSGFIGHCSEISSAETQEPAGCWAQAWSASTLVELLSKGRFL